MHTTAGTATIPLKTETRIRPLRWPWVHLVQPTHFVIRELILPLEQLDAAMDGMRIVVLSDLHLTPAWHEAYDKVFSTVDALQAEAVLITGDIVEDRKTHLPAMPVIRRFLPALRSRLGTISILGNHDSVALGKDMERLGVQVLNGKRTLLQTSGGALELIGAPGPLRKDMPRHFPTQFGPPVSGVPRIVLAHFPDHFPKLKVLRPDIYLCGHTHGGQICLPTGTMLVRHDHSPRRLCHGYHRIGQTHYIVNQGLGFSGPPIRMFCPPEVLLLVLRRGG